jgi:(4S)-4-hydroxy-5-phosphonooxypentane-2,3-dione isomerase
MALFVLIAEIQVKPDTVEQFIPLILANAQASVRNEPGCYQFDVTQQADDPTKFVFYEVYADAAAFENHSKQPHFQTFFEKAKDMIVSRVRRTQTRIAGFHKH